MTEDEVAAYLTQRGIQFDISTVQGGRLLKTRTPLKESVCFYATGSIVVGGKAGSLKQSLQAWKDSGLAPSTIAVDGQSQSGPEPVGVDRRVFVVYGHDSSARDGLELILRQMGLDPIVLANLPASGDTIIEKLEKHLGGTGNVGFACVLLTPDDRGHAKDSPDDIQYRARQNVILELGMVLARLGRKRVAILYKETVERPSDIAGLIYLPFKEDIKEVKLGLAKEFQSAGYAPNISAL